MIAFIDDHRSACGLEPQSGSRPICRVLPIAPSTYPARVAQRADPTLGSAGLKRDAMLLEEVRRVHAENFGVYGVPKVWRQLGREGTAAWCAGRRPGRRCRTRARSARLTG